jgi:hypothetical protein
MDGEVVRMNKKRRMVNQPHRSSRRSKLLSMKQKRRRKSIKRPFSNRSQPRRIRTLDHHFPDFTAGVSEGAAWRSSIDFDPSLERFREVVHEHFSRRFHETNRNKSTAWMHVQQRGKKYVTGFMKGSKIDTSISPIPLQNKAAAVVCASTGSAALNDVLSQLNTLPLQEIVLVLCNPADEMFSLARSYKNTVIAYFPDEVDPDVGRAMGVKLTDADTVLFVDGERAVDANLLARFLWECDGRVDIALNDLSAQMGLFHQRNSVERFHEFLNTSLNRVDLKTNSMSDLPFAVSRHALNTLGPAVLAVPVKAHAIAILNGLRIGTGGSAGSRMYKDNWKKAAGDHVEAWREAMNARGSRLQFADSIRNRNVLGDFEQ